MTVDNFETPFVRHPLRFVLRILAPALWAAILFWLSLTPSPPQVPEPFDWDKLQHAGAYGLLTLLLVRAKLCLSPHTEGRSWLIAGLAAVGYGGLLEFLQWSAQSGRSAEWADFFANTAGVLICYVVFRHQGIIFWPGKTHPGKKHG